jgi:hypothetical protein
VNLTKLNVQNAEEIDWEALALVHLVIMMMEMTFVPCAIINVEHAKINQKIA